jgi:hypothetical protein
LDGHTSRVAPVLWEKFAAARIDVLCLPAHSSHLLQPLDKFVNARLKQELRHVGKFPGKRSWGTELLPFLRQLRTAFHKAHEPATILRSFEATGLLPFNPGAVLSSLPLTYSSPLGARTAQTQRLNINGRLLTESAVISEMRIALGLPAGIDDEGAAEGSRAPEDVIEEVIVYVGQHDEESTPDEPDIDDNQPVLDVVKSSDADARPAVISAAVEQKARPRRPAGGRRRPAASRGKRLARERSPSSSGNESSSFSDIGCSRKFEIPSASKPKTRRDPILVDDDENDEATLSDDWLPKKKKHSTEPPEELRAEERQLSTAKRR